MRRLSLHCESAAEHDALITSSLIRLGYGIGMWDEDGFFTMRCERAAANVYASSQDAYNRALAMCLQGRGYTVN
jgi:hypothetical protein